MTLKMPQNVRLKYMSLAGVNINKDWVIKTAFGWSFFRFGCFNNNGLKSNRIKNRTTELLLTKVYLF